MPVDDLLGTTRPRRSPFRAAGRRRILITAAGAVGLVVTGAVAGVAVTGSHGGGVRSLPTLLRPTTRETTTTTTLKPKPQAKPKPPVTVPRTSAPPAIAPPGTTPRVTAPAPVATTPPTVACPTGSPVVQVTAVYHHPDPDIVGTTDYSASGTITNRGTGSMVPGAVFVYFNDAKGVTMDFGDMSWPLDAAGHDLTPIIPPGGTVAWDLRWNRPPIDSVVLMEAPAAVVAKLSSWFWGSPFENCLAFGGT